MSVWVRDRVIGPYGATIRTRVRLLYQTPSANTSRVRTEVLIYKGAGSNNAIDASVATSISGDVIASKTMGINVASNSWQWLWDVEYTIPHDADGGKSFSVTGTLGPTDTGTFGNGGSATVTGTLPALILPPTPPSWGSTSYSSPTRVVASWSNNATARGPYDRIDIQRFDGGRWWVLGRLSAGATSYTDSDLPGNDEVQYRVQAVGPGGLSGWTYGGRFSTVPDAPSGVSARKSGPDILVSWQDNAAPTNRTRTFLIEDSPNGGAWVQVGSIGGSATGWTHSSPDPAVTHRYRVRAQITSGITLTSSYSVASATVQLQAPPGQPGRAAPSDSDTLVVGDPVTLSWVHNPVDTTAQTGAEVQHRIDGGAWQTVTVGAVESVTVTPVVSGSRALLEWRVRTKGDHPDWSPWSTTGGPLLSTQPSLAVQSPGPVLDTSRVTVAWSYTANGAESQLAQSGWRVILSDWATGSVLETETGTTQESVGLDTRLDNETQYVVTVSARNGDGLWSDLEVVNFTTEFPLPQPVLVTPAWDRETASVSIGFSVQDVPGHTAVDALDVERRDQGGDWVLIASGISTTTTVTDRTPKIGATEYRAISRTVLPTETVGPTGVAAWPFPIEGAYVSGGAGFGRVCKAMGAAASDAPGIEQTTHRFAGIQKPVAFFGTGRTHDLSFTGTIPLAPNETAVSTREDWEELLHEYGVALYRDPVGRKRFGLLTVSFSQSGPLESLSLEVQEVHWTEGVRRVSDLELEEML